MASDKNKGKFPYIVLPSLSSEDNPKRTIPVQKKSKNVPLKAVSVPNTSINLPPVISTQPEPLSPRSMTSSVALTRHIALSKQFAAAASANSVQEIQAAQRRILMAHYEMRKSPRSFYPSDSETTELTEPLGPSKLEKQSRKLSLEALAQLFPHRIPRTKESSTQKQEDPKKSKAPDDVPTTQRQKQVVKEIPKIPDCTDKKLIASQGGGDGEQLKTRMDGLTVHVTNRDEETTQLKHDLIDLQLLVLKEKKESEKSRMMVERLNREIAILQNKLLKLETTVEAQERNILDKLLLLDGMDDTDSESDFGKIDCKPSAWISSSPSQKQIQPKPEQKSSDTGITALKECMNWVPVAPDFDKLLQIISLLNFRMDKNQSMKLCRTGNSTSFKHADTINLTLFKNGLVLGKSGFRSYATLSVIKMINEMFSGYFPSELHSQYPDGIVFVVTDKRSILHELNASFFGPGVKLCDSKSTPILLPGLEKLKDFMKPREIIKPAETTVSCTSVSSKLSSVSSSTSFCTLPELPTLNQSSSDSFKDGHKLITLKLKNTTTGTAYKMRVSTSTTIEEVLSHVEKYGEDNSIDASMDNSKETKVTGKFDLVLPVPHGVLTSGNATLKDYGFVQNTLLYLKPACE